MTETTEGLKTNVTTSAPARREIEAELSAEETAREYERVLDEFAGRAKLKGFRPGMAPRDMVRQMFDHDIRHSVVDALIPRILEEVLAARDIHPVGVPSVTEVHYDEGGPLKFKAMVETWPDFELPSYTGIRVSKRTAAVPDEDIDKTVADLREKAAEYLPIEDRPAAAGDYVVIELQGRDTRTKRLMPVEKAVVLVGHEGNDPVINEHLPGMAPGEERTFRHAYPADFPAKRLAGREIEYRLKAVSIKEKKLPEPNDDFAKTLGEFDSIAAVRDKIRAELSAAREQAARRETADDVLRDLLDRTSIVLPESLVEEETEAVLRNALSQAPPRQPLTKEAAEALKAAGRKQAETNLKSHMVLERIARDERIDVTEEEIDAEIAAIAAANHLPLARARESFESEGRKESLGQTLRNRKTIDFLVGRAIIE
jgi:trigger factor